MRNKETNIKEKFESLVKKAKQIESRIKKPINDIIENDLHIISFINSHYYYLKY